MTARETLIEDMQGIETVLCALEDECTDRCLTEKQVIRALARTIWHILTWIIKRIDEERRNK